MTKKKVYVNITIGCKCKSYVFELVCIICLELGYHPLTLEFFIFFIKKTPHMINDVTWTTTTFFYSPPSKYHNRDCKD